MKETYRYVDEHGKHEYRFEDGLCIGFFSNNILTSDLDTTKPITEMWRENLKTFGFTKIEDLT